MKKRTLGINRQFILLIIGFLVVVASISLINQASLSSEVVQRDCGSFFSSNCISDNHWSERERITEFSLNIPAVIGALIASSFLMTLSVLAIDNSSKPTNKKVTGLVIPWIIGLSVAVGFLAIGGPSQDEREFIGAITYEEQACFNQSLRALDMQGPWPEDCPTSPSAAAYWQSMMTDF